MTQEKSAFALRDIARNAYARKWSFLAAFLAVWSASLLTLGALDLLPNPPSEQAVAREASPEITLSASPLVAPASPNSLLSADLSAASLFNRGKGEFPQRIEIPSLGLSADVMNPANTSIAALDDALLAGAVRYPTSALLGKEGNVILFGHSSYLPVVNNPAFKAFTGIEKLHIGDRITVYGKEHAYVYAVEEVMEADADSDGIPLTVEGAKLTLSTCDSFGAKTKRFVVVASLIETKDL